jgi:hypothetical protein
MKTIKQGLIVVALALLPFASCVDDLKFGNSFLEKAPGGTVTQDTVFNNAEYTRQFLIGIYTEQFYGLNYANAPTNAYNSYWTGMVDMLTDHWTAGWNNTAVRQRYYAGTVTSGDGGTGGRLFSYDGTRVWQAVRSCYLLLENIDGVPGLSDGEKEQMKAEAKALIASRYFDMFRFYGSIPIVRASFSGADATYEAPRGTVEEMVDFIVGLLDEAAAVLPWQVANPAVESGRWTKAGAMGLKTSVLLFAASPLFNSEAPYAPGEAADAHNIWWGGYKPELWNRALTACEEFFRELNANGQYMLEQANGTRPEDYRLAFRKAYYRIDSREILHSTRVTTTTPNASSNYTWWWVQNSRPTPGGDKITNGAGRGANPTQEYVEIFPWADGTPFDWNKEEAAGTLDRMFIERVVDPSVTGTAKLTRDPRLYESVIVNGLPVSLDWNTGTMSGEVWETFLNGYHAKTGPSQGLARFGTGYTLHKYWLGTDGLTQEAQWSYIRLAEIYMNYAEALCQTGQLQAAIDQVDIIRARVGLKGLVASYPDKNLTGDKAALLEEILLERSREFGMENHRYFDLIRHKRADRFEQPLHRLLITRKDKGGSWLGTKVPWPEFNYERLPITNPTRVWWTDGFDPKYYLCPFPLGELNKGYGLVQNPGW